MNTIFITGLSGYLTGWIGIFTGIILSFFIKGRGRRFKGTLLGFIGGFMLAIVCFDLLPESLESGSIYTSVVGISLGIILAIILDGILEYEKIYVSDYKNNNFLKAAIFLAIGIGIHNIPSGVALGSLLSTSPIEGLKLSIALILHGIPEGLTIGIFLRECKASKFKFLIISILTSIPMGLGSILGGIISSISPAIISINLSFAAGMILYITFRETIPSCCEIWKGRMSTIGNVLGITTGMLMLSFFH